MVPWDLHLISVRPKKGFTSHFVDDVGQAIHLPSVDRGAVARWLIFLGILSERANEQASQLQASERQPSLIILLATFTTVLIGEQFCLVQPSLHLGGKVHKFLSIIAAAAATVVQRP